MSCYTYNSRMRPIVPFQRCMKTVHALFKTTMGAHTQFNSPAPRQAENLSCSKGHKSSSNFHFQ